MKRVCENIERDLERFGLTAEQALCVWEMGVYYWLEHSGISPVVPRESVPGEGQRTSGSRP